MNLRKLISNWFNLIPVEDFNIITDELIDLQVDYNKLLDVYKIETTRADVDQAEYWNNKWEKSEIYYSAPRRKQLIQYVRYRDIPAVDVIAIKIANEAKKLKSIDEVPLLTMKWIKSQNFRYKRDKKETWNTPEQTLANKRKGNDCDDIGILEYFIIRKAFMLLDVWNDVRHRLKCVCGNVNSRNKVPYQNGAHFYLIWLHSDGNWYGVESTYYLYYSIRDFDELPIKYNPIYGVIWWTFNEEHMWSQHNISISKLEYKNLYEKK